MENCFVIIYTVSHQHITVQGFQEKQEILQEKKLIGNPDFLQDSHLKREVSSLFSASIFTRRSDEQEWLDN